MPSNFTISRYWPLLAILIGLGIGAARSERQAPATTDRLHRQAASAAPAGFVYVPGGMGWTGSDDQDADGDGFQGTAVGGNGEDCDDLDASVNPGADESVPAGNCSDGVDNDCDALTDGDEPDCAGCPFPCADITGDGSVNLTDFATFAFCFGSDPVLSQACTCSDLNTDGVINLTDFATFSLLFGQSPTSFPPNCQ